MSKTDTCTKCGREGHTASSCKRVQCVSCAGFRMTLRKILYTCERVKRGSSLIEYTYATGVHLGVRFSCPEEVAA